LEYEGRRDLGREDHPIEEVLGLSFGEEVGIGIGMAAVRSFSSARVGI